MRSGKFLAGDHALRRIRDLMRAGSAELVGELEAAANLKHRDDVGDGEAFSEPKPGRCNVHCSPRVIRGIGLIRASLGKRSGESKRVLPAG